MAALAVPAAAGAAPSPARVIGGSPVPEGGAPWVAALVRHNARNAQSGQSCAGSVIAPTVVLTAAHCVDDRKPADVDVVTGRTRLSSGAGQRIRVASIAISPDWNPSGLRHDVAVLGLEVPTLAPPIGFAGPAQGALVRPGTELLATGWGRQNEAPGTAADDLQQVPLFVFPQDSCDGRYRAFDATFHLCAGGRNGPNATCKGDSGGGVIGFDGPAPLVTGLVSFGSSHCADGGPRVYARVPTEAAWIAAQAGLPPPAEPIAVTPRITRAKCRSDRCAVDVAIDGDDSSVGGVSVRVSGTAGPVEALPTASDWRADFKASRPARRASAQALDAAGQPLGPPARASVR
jgi:secreted trypsin-like serine protease